MNRIPSELLYKSRTIEELRDGERAWALVDVVRVGHEGMCWLNRYQSIHRRAYGREMVEIFRTAGDFNAILPRKRYRTSEPPASEAAWMQIVSVCFQRCSWLHRPFLRSPARSGIPQNRFSS